MIVTKQAVLDQFRAVLQADLDTLMRAAQGAFAAATDPDSKAENKYDTRTLEASYIARGQAKRVAELQEAVQAFSALSGGQLDEGSAASLASLVALDGPDGLDHYFIGPAAGGTEILHEGREVVIITPNSPMGQKLVGSRVGDRVAMRPAVTAKVVSVQ
jgi:transcription elongation GreA/GreB family factor